MPVSVYDFRQLTIRVEELEKILSLLTDTKTQEEDVSNFTEEMKALKGKRLETREGTRIREPSFGSRISN